MRTLLLFLGLLLPTTGCDTAVDPVLGTEQAYTFYGLLNPTDSTQTLHLYPIEDRLRPYALSGSAAARVTVAPTETPDAETVWKGSVRRIEGSVLYFYEAPIQVAYDTRYKVLARGPRGRTSAEVRIPQEAHLVVGQPDTLTTAVRQPVRVDAPVPNLLNVEVRYAIKFLPGQIEETTDTVAFSYEEETRSRENDWLIPIHLSRDHELMMEQLRARNVWRKRGYEEWGMKLLGMRLLVTVGNRPWDPPPGGFDPELLVQPGTMSNVDNGFGFVAAGYGLSKEWLPDDAVLVKAGFRSLYE